MPGPPQRRALVFALPLPLLYVPAFVGLAFGPFLEPQAPLWAQTIMAPGAIGDLMTEYAGVPAGVAWVVCAGVFWYVIGALLVHSLIIRAVSYPLLLSASALTALLLAVALGALP